MFGHVFIKRKKNGKIQKGCLAFQITESNQFQVQLSKVHMGNSEFPQDHFSRKEGREIAYEHLEKNPILISDHTLHSQLINEKMIPGIHMTYLVSMPWKCFNNRVLARLAVQSAIADKIIEPNWSIPSKNKKN